jgi:3-phenylpropionate/trans-cinnamate dioxygenase ferredoxin component
MTQNQTNDKDIEYFQIIPESELAIGERIFVEIDGNPIMIINQDGTIHAISDFCSHDHGPLGDGEVTGDVIICPRHGARFNLITGKVLSLPALFDIPVYPVRVKNNYIEIGMAKGQSRNT